MIDFSNADKRTRNYKDLLKLIAQPEKKEGEPETSVLDKLISNLPDRPKDYEPPKPYEFGSFLSDIQKNIEKEPGPAIMDTLGSIAKLTTNPDARRILSGLMSPEAGLKFSELTEKRRLEEKQDQLLKAEEQKKKQLQYDQFTQNLLAEQLRQALLEEGKQKQFGRDIVGEELKLSREKELIGHKAIQESNLSKEVKELALKKTGDGWQYLNDFPDRFKNQIPKQAIQKVGTANDYILMVKPPKDLGDAKYTVSRQAAKDAQSILDLVKSGQITQADFKRAQTENVKLLGTKSQSLSAALKLISEGLGRALSGAVITPEERKEFQELFAVKFWDTTETIKYKLQRTIDIVDSMIIMSSYGASPEEMKASYSKYKTTYATDISQAIKESPADERRIANQFLQNMGVTTPEPEPEPLPNPIDQFNRQFGGQNK